MCIRDSTKTCGVQKTCIEPMATYFTIEMLGMVDALHKAEILHADIKADNFLLQGIPLPNQAARSMEEMFQELSPSLQLIDFGKSIDLKLLPKDILFTKVLKKLPIPNVFFFQSFSPIYLFLFSNLFDPQVVKTDGLMCPEMRESRGWR